MPAVLGRGSTFTTTAGNKTSSAVATLLDLYVVVCAASGTSAANADTTSVTDDNTDGLGTYTLIVETDNTQTTRLKIFVRNALVQAAVTTVVTANQANSNGGGLAVFRVTGMQRAGAGAVVKSKAASFAAAGTPAATFGSAVNTANATCGGLWNGTSPATVTEPTGWTEQVDLGYSTPTTGLETIRRDSGFSGTTVTWGSTSATAGAVALIELDATVPPELEAPVRTIMQAVKRASSW